MILFSVLLSFVFLNLLLPGFVRGRLNGPVDVRPGGPAEVLSGLPFSDLLGGRAL